MRVVASLAAVLVLTLGAGSVRAQAAVPVEGSWKGESSAHLPLSFGVQAGQVVNLRFKFSWGFCGTFESSGNSAAIDANGHWVFEDPRGQTVEGTFTAPDQVEGKIVSVERELPGCPRTEAAFTGAPVPPNPESLAAARAGIEALSYKIDLQRARGTKNALIGNVSGSRGAAFRFFLFVNRKPAKHLRKVPGYGTHGPNHELPDRGLEGGQLANTDYFFNTVPRHGESKAQKVQQHKILTAIKDPICVRQTGQTCPLPPPTR
jgi:hypothetical protein